MINPGLIYLVGAGILYFIKDKLRGQFTVLLSGIALFYIWLLPAGAEIAVDFLDFQLLLLASSQISRVLATGFIIFGLASGLYAVGHGKQKYYSLAAVYIGGAVGILFVGDLFSFYICWELMTISSYFLIYTNQRPITRQTSYYYFIMHVVGAVSLLWAIILHYNAVGAMAITTLSAGLPFVFLAVGIKLAFFGLHTWLPQTYAEVPFYISVVLSAYTTKVGVYALYKLVGGGKLIAYLGVFSALGGVAWALRQVKIRKLLCYHLISQVGYMIAGLGMSMQVGTAGALLHLLNNVLYKGLLFMVAGTIIYTTGKEKLTELGGLAKKLPWTAGFGLLAALAIAGVPFLNGHVSKLLLKKGSSDPVVTWGLYLAGIGTAVSFLKFVYYAFFNSGTTDCQRRPKTTMLVGMGILAGGSLFIGLQPEVIVKNILGLQQEIHYFSLHYLWAGLQPALWAGAIFMLARDLVAPHEHGEIGVDPYLYLGRGVDYIGQQLSQLHNGNLQRYLFWLVSSLVGLLVIFLL